MKTAALPAIPVEPEFLDEVKSVLAEGETLEHFLEASVRAGIERPRGAQATFIARALRSRNDARLSVDYVDADAVCDELQRKLDAARARIERSPK